MAYIYKITNDINQKIYIGKTEFSVEKRFKEHCQDAFKEHEQKRPLYSAMKKYGLEHFHVEVVEETDIPEEREIYWIEYFGSFKNGYNATRGGDGKRYLDYDLVFDLYQKGKNLKEIAAELHCSPDACSNILHSRNISTKELVDRGRDVIRKTYIQRNKDTNEIINIFSSLKDAYAALGKENSGHIASVCQGKRKTAYGYKWEYGK